MSITYYPDLEQGSIEWLTARLGILTASQMKHVITSSLKSANNDKSRAIMWELLSQRINAYIEESYFSDDMMRGIEDEIDAVAIYSKNYAPVDVMGFITNDKWGFTLGYSPDGLVGDNGLVECKSRNQKLQTKTIVDYVSNETIDPDFMIQCQTGLLVSEREWIDLISYCSGMPMATVRVYPDATIQAAIIVAASEFEKQLQEAMVKYNKVLSSGARLIATERKIEEEMR